jgi:hypothetical protein
VAKNIVFVLHGIGQYTDGWMDLESCAVPALKKAASSYAFFEGKSLDTFVEFVPIFYDDVFERILQHWADLGQGLLAANPVMPGKFADKVIKLMTQANENKWSLKTGADVALYWGFRLFQQRVVLRVLAQMTTRIADTIGAGERPEYHVLAHSMGTAVAHDALHHLGTEPWLAAVKKANFDGPDVENARADRDTYLENHARASTTKDDPFNPRHFTFSSITMLSNVTGLIHPSASPYQSIVRPGSATDNGACTTNYFNVNHKFDPISLVGNFEMPPGWKLSNGVDLRFDHLTDDIEHLHDAAHYVSHPAIHLRLLQQYVDIYVPTADDFSQIAAFQKKFGIENQGSSALKAFAKGDTGPLGELVKKLRILEKLVEE